MLNAKKDPTWTLFLDRDGVINQRNFEGYITRVEDFIFLPKVIEGLKLLAPQFSKIIVVTNQQGIGKGIMTEGDLDEIHNFMIKALAVEGVYIDKVYFASNLRGEEPDRRKPNAAMALEAKSDFPDINFEHSVMVGDTASDLKFGMNLGMKTALIQSEEKVAIIPDFSVKNLKELANEIIR